MGKSETIRSNSISIDSTDLQVFKYLYNHPMDSVRSLAAKIDGSKQLVTDRIEKMKRAGLIRKKKKMYFPGIGYREQSEVELGYNAYSLGLKKINVLVDNLEYNRDDLNTLRRIFSDHPYFHSISHFFGMKTAILLVFECPNSVANSIKYYIEQLSEVFEWDNFKLLDPNFTHTYNTPFPKLNRTRDNLLELKYKSSNRYNAVSPISGIKLPDTYIEREFAIFKDMLEFEQHALNNQPILNIQDTENMSFDQLDLQLVVELNINPKTQVKELASAYNTSSSTISRRITKLKQNVCGDARLQYNKSFFNIEPLVLLTMEQKYTTATEIIQFFQFLDLPVNFHLSGIGDEYIILFETHTSFMTGLVDFIQKQFSKTRAYINKKETNYTYYLSPRNFKDNEWIVSPDYLVDKPLQSLDRKDPRIQSLIKRN